MQGTTLRGFTILALLTLPSSAAWANSPPIVSSVVAVQRADKAVEIRYDLTDAENDFCFISVQASNDAGATWGTAITALAGDVGAGIVPGAGKLIVWDSKIDLPGVVGSQFKVRICADDGHNLDPTISSPSITGILMQGSLGTVVISCTAGDLDGTVKSVTVNLTAIGGSAAESLSKSTGSRWQRSISVTPATRGLKNVTFTATDDRGASVSAQASIMVAPPGMVYVPGGEFQMGDSFGAEGDVDERPMHSVRVTAFFMDLYEVTNQEYAAALNWALAQGGLITVTNGMVYQSGKGTSYPYCDTTASSPYSHVTWDGQVFGAVSGREDYPVVLVSWYGAVAFANWRSGMQGLPLGYNLSTWECNWGTGYRLPTEAEWERAARGGAVGRRFPWTDADTIDHSRANYYSSSAPVYDLALPVGFSPAFSTGTAMPYTSPVGYFPANAYGLYDVAGNVWEWCNDWFGSTYYSSSPYQDPRGPASGSTRVLRGGSWGSIAVNQRCAFRSDGLPGYRAIVNGFRVALSSQ